MLYNNSLVDYWFEAEILPSLQSLNYATHFLTPELIKYKLLQNQAFCFKYESLIVIGEISFTADKEFYILFLTGKNIGKHYLEFFEELERFGISKVTGHNIRAVNIIHQRYLKQLNYNLDDKNFYFVDLLFLEYALFVRDEDQIKVMDNSNIDYWWKEISFNFPSTSTLKHKLLNNQLICYAINNCVIIGFVDYGLYCKRFVIVDISLDGNIYEIARFCNFLEMNLFCRYISSISKNFDEKYSDLFESMNIQSIAMKKQTYSILSLI